MKETVGKLLNDVSDNFVLKAKRNRAMNKSVLKRKYARITWLKLNAF